MDTKTRLEIIEETKDFYSEDVSRRALVENLYCAYLTEDGNRCAFGRCEIDPPLAEEFSIFIDSSVKGRFENSFHDFALKPEYRGHPIEFWTDLQYFHDLKENWSPTGISPDGLVQYKLLKKKWA